MSFKIISLLGKYEMLYLSIVICLYLFLTAAQINLPGMHHDEVMGASGTIEVLKRENISFRHGNFFLEDFP